MFTAAAESFLKQARYPGWGVEVPVEGRRAPLGRGGGGGRGPAGRTGPRAGGAAAEGRAGPGLCLTVAGGV